MKSIFGLFAFIFSATSLPHNYVTPPNGSQIGNNANANGISNSKNNQPNNSAAVNGSVSPYYVWSPRPRWGSYSAGADEGYYSGQGISNYHGQNVNVSNDQNLQHSNEGYHSQDGIDNYHGQHTNVYNGQNRPSRYSVENGHIQLNG